MIFDYRKSIGPARWKYAITCQIITCLVVSLAFVSTSRASSPKENFASWYTAWIESLPPWHKVTRKRFFGNKGGKPLIKTVTDWKNGEYRICSLDNSETNNTYKLLVNFRYAAQIVTTLGSIDPVWSISDFALRTDSHYDSLVSGFGISKGFLYQHELLFKRPYSSVYTANIESTGKSQLVLQFEREALSEDRQALEIEITLDEEFGGMPVEIAVTELGGIQSRHVVSGWHLLDEVWVYDTVKIYIQMPDKQAEELHSTKSWEFGGLAGAPQSEKECFLKYYGLPEPPASGLGELKVVFFLLAVFLITAGYAVFRSGRK